MSDAKSRLEALKGAFEKKTTGGGGDQNWKLFFQFWKIPDDSTAVVRFLPDLDADNSLGFLVENLQHELEINGQRKKVPCLAMHGEHCPICELSRKYYDEKNEDLGKKFYRKKSYIGQVIIVDSPIEHDQNQLVKLIEFGPAVFKQIQSAFQSGDLEEAPYEFKGGYNFRIKKTKSGQYASYNTSSFAPKQSDLDDDVIGALELYNLADYRGTKPDVTTVEALLVAAQTGQAFDEDNSDSNSTPKSSEPVVAEKVNTVEVAAETVKQEEVKPDAPVPSDKATSLIDQLRARANANKAASE